MYKYKMCSTETAGPGPTIISKNGSPKNYWHLRECTKEGLDTIFAELGFKVEWKFINGPFEGPFTVTPQMLTENTISLVPVILLDGEYDD